MAMNVTALLQELADALETAKAKGAQVEHAGAYLTATKADAQKSFDTLVGAAQATFDAAKGDYSAAQATVEALRQQVNDTIGELLPQSRARVR